MDRKKVELTLTSVGQALDCVLYQDLSGKFAIQKISEQLGHGLRPTRPW